MVDGAFLFFLDSVPSIRHRNDWGAIILLDSRYSQSKITGSLSKWLRDRVQKFDKLKPAADSLKDFVAKCIEFEKVKAEATLEEESKKVKEEGIVMDEPRVPYKLENDRDPNVRDGFETLHPTNSTSVLVRDPFKSPKPGRIDLSKVHILTIHEKLTISFVTLHLLFQNDFFFDLL